jgi:hypothetical protein
MKAKQIMAIAGFTAGAAGAYAIKQVREKRQAITNDAANRWHIVTINRPVKEVVNATAALEPLHRLGTMVEIEIRPAPGNRGTELAARLDKQQVESAEIPRALRRLRAALRKSQWLLETGEVLSADWPPSATTTPLNAPLTWLTNHGREEGRL